MNHRMDWMTDICMECGIDREALEDGASAVCVGGDHRRYQLSRHRLLAYYAEVRAHWGAEPEQFDA